MATPLGLVRLALSGVLAAAMLAACSGSQMGGSSLGTAPQTVGASNSQQSGIMPSDGGGCGGNGQSGIHQNGGGGCCGSGDMQPNDGSGGGCCGGGGGGDVQRNDGGQHQKCITVSPNKIFFTPSSSGPVTVNVRTQMQGTVSELDDCASTGIATISQGTGTQWTVTAGSTTGSCKALFTLKNSNGKKIGHAVLHITNLI